MTVMIRRRHAVDLDACVSLLAAVHATDRYPVHWPGDPGAWLAPANLLGAWVAEQEDGLAGHVGLRTAHGDSSSELWSQGTELAEDRLGVVTRLFVATSSRGRGLGERLLGVACAEARCRGLRPVLDVLEHDRGAVALYERLGWRRLGSVDHPLPGGHVALLHCYAAPGDDP